MSWLVPRWTSIPGLDHSFGDRHFPAPQPVTTLRQIHGQRVYDLQDLRGREVEGDGLVTDRIPSRVGVWTADCVPVHLLAPGARVAAVVHAGWRGSAAGVVETAVDLLTTRWNLRPHEIEAAMGPAIGGCCYRVGDEVRAAFESRYGALGRTTFDERDGSLYLDLRKFLAAQLKSLGVSTVERIGPCTACRTDLLCSYRKEGQTGRQLSFIGWRGEEPGSG